MSYGKRCEAAATVTVGGGNGVVSTSRRPKSRDISSRYLTVSSSTSLSTSSSSSSSSTASVKTCLSPLVSSGNISATPAAVRRSRSAERRRSGTPRTDLTVSAAQRMLFASGESFSASFQEESVSKRKTAAAPGKGVIRGTPERRKREVMVMEETPGRVKDQTENAKQQPPEQNQLWPSSRRKSSASRSVDYIEERKTSSGTGRREVTALQNSMLHNRASCDGKLMTGFPTKAKKDEHIESNLSEIVGTSTSGAKVEIEKTQCAAARGMMVPARFLQGTNSRVGRQQLPGSTISKNGNGLKTMMSPKVSIMPKKFGFESQMFSPRGTESGRGQLSPICGPVRPVSPNKVATPAALNLFRGTSPSRARSGVISAVSGNLCGRPSILSFAADIRRANIGEDRMADAHLLRLFYNTLLQWRFVNARGDATLSAQKLNVVRILYNAWLTVWRMQDSVRAKRIELQLLKQNLKLVSVLKGQMTCLDEWPTIEEDHSGSLLGAVEALKASTIRLPVIGGATANVQRLKVAICSALDVMHAMASSVCLLLSKVGEVNSLAAELVNVAAKEQAMINQFKELLSTVSPMQVVECSLRTNILQLGRLHTSRLTTQL